MKKCFIILIFLLLIGIASCKNKYEFTDEAITLQHGKLYSNSITFDGEIYHIYSGKILVGSINTNSKVTLVNVYYNSDNQVTRVEPYKTLILKKDKTYPITLTIAMQNTMMNSQVIEYVGMRQGLYIYENYDVTIDTSYNER